LDFGRIKIYIFLRTAHDVYDSIDIVEKYKIISLKRHNQAKQRETKEKQLTTGGLDWNIDTAPHKQTPEGWIGAAHHQNHSTSPSLEHKKRATITRAKGSQRINYCHRQRRRCPTPD
jgi:hypothetical protein